MWFPLLPCGKIVRMMISDGTAKCGTHDESVYAITGR